MDEYTRLVAYSDSLESMLQSEWHKSPRTRASPRLPTAFPKTNLAHPDLVVWIRMIEHVLTQVVADNEKYNLEKEN
jgi:hypothetical protein